MRSSLSSETGPRWIRDLLRLWLDELRLFGRTALGLVRGPRRFGADWASGRLQAMNPLGFLAASWPLVLPLDYGMQRWLGWDQRPDVGLAIELARAFRPYVIVFPIAALAHLLLRGAGIERRRFSTTLGILLYWITFSTAFWLAGLAVCFAAPRSGSLVPQVFAFVSMIWGALALAGALGVRRWVWCLAVLVGTGLLIIEGLNRLILWVGWQ